MFKVEYGDMGKKRIGLNALYDTLNQDYFRGRLPRFRVNMTDLSRYLSSGWCRMWKREILLSQSLGGDHVRQTLLHEMIHVSSKDLRHGPSFRRGLRRLGLMGEAWALNEVEFYKEEEKDRLFKKRIKKRWELDVAEVIEYVAMEHPNMKWIKVRRYLAQYWNTPQWEVLKIAPWLKGYWYHQASQAKRMAEQQEAMRSRLLPNRHT